MTQSQMDFSLLVSQNEQGIGDGQYNIQEQSIMLPSSNMITLRIIDL